VERVAGAAVDLEQRLAALQIGGDALVALLGIALGVEDQPGDDDREDDDQQAEDDEGPLAHLAARILSAPLPARPLPARLSRYQGHIRRSAHSSQRGFG